MNFFNRITKEELTPKILTLKEPIKAVGFSVKTSNKSISNDATEVGKKFSDFKKSNMIKNRKDPWAFVAVSKNYDENSGIWDYFIGDVVTDFNNISEDLTTIEIPAIKYAIFPIRPRFKFAWGIVLGQMKRYIYEKWLPGSKYEPAEIIDDFEYHDERSIRKKEPEIDLYIGVK